ncbi:MAG: hypothetical protein AB1586_02610 [Pseudomonadota bacterium]
MKRYSRVVAALCIVFSAGQALPSQAQEAAVLYEEVKGGAPPDKTTGRVTWRTEQVQPAKGQFPETAIRADIEIPSRVFKMSAVIQLNRDPSMPASHLTEVRFTLPPNFSGGSIQNAPGLLVGSGKGSRPVTIRGLAVKVEEGFFLIGFSNPTTDRQHNIRLLKEGKTIEIPFVYAGGLRADVVIEKGPSGQAVIDQALKAWGQ